MLVLVAPGQGAQTPGFLTPWLDLPGVPERLDRWSAVCGLDLVHYGTKADADAIRDTAVAQPLLVAAGLISAYALFDEPIADVPRLVGAAAGHSVGEFTVAAITGVLEDDATLSFVRRRGLAMAEAAAATRTGMSAVLGGDPEQVVMHLEKLGLTPANMNGSGQIVAAGTVEQLAALDAEPPEQARIRHLQVAGAFHTHHMAPAVATLEALVPSLATGDPRTRYVSNKDGGIVGDGREIVRRMVDQVSNPVRWDLCTQTFQELGITALVEVAPAGTLTGLARRGMRGVQRVAVKTPDHIDAARALIAEHGAGPDAAESSTGSTAE